MKKLLLLTLSAFGWTCFAQSPYKNLKVHPAAANKTAIATKHLMSDPSIPQSSISKKPAAAFKAKKSAAPVSSMGVDTLIGTTTYDLQTNSAVANRIVYNGAGTPQPGTVQATWTFSLSYDLGAADRGTGYNFFDGNAWEPTPTARIEGGTRTGWPEIITLGNGTEVVIAHAPALNNLVMSTRNPYGSGTWDVNPLSDIYPSALWPRAAAGGSDGNTIHIIAHDESTSASNAKLFYSRSQDGGISWDINSIEIPGIDATNYRMISGDSYAIHARENYVAVVYFGGLERTVIAKSSDNGTTWTSRQVFDIPFIYDFTSTNTTGLIIGISDADGDGVADTLESTDGAGTVIIDENGTAHVFWGMMNNLDEAADGTGGSWFPFTDGVGYWNEKMGDMEPQVIAGSLDLDGSGMLFDEANNGIDVGLYYTSTTGMVNAALDDNGCLYVVYAGLVETLNSGAQFYRHIYGVKSCDDGCTWSYPIDLTPNDEFAECVFPSMAHQVGSKFHLIYQRDAEPGLAVRGDEDPFVLNEIIYLKEDATRLDTALYACIGGIIAPLTSFCNGDSVLLTATCGTSWNWSTGETTQNIYAKTFSTISCDIGTACGYNIVDDVTLTAQSSAPEVTVTASVMVSCPGDSVTLTTNDVSSATWSWSPGGETTQTIVVTNPGTYTVTVQNCGGTTTDSITIAQPPAPVVTITASSSVACPGDSVTLTTNNFSDGSWAWSTGDNTQTIIVTDTGNYSVTVTTCGGSTLESIFIDVPPAPVANISGPSTICTGDTIQLDAPTGSGLTYLWSTAETTASIMVSSVGTYSLTVTNCGGIDSISADITTTPVPTAAISAFGATTFCQGGSVGLTASGAGVGGSYVWYPNGETTQTITVNSSGDYTVTAFNACGDSANSSATTVTVNPNPIVPSVVTYTLGSQWGFTCGGCDSLGTLQWYLNGTAMAGETNDTLLAEWNVIGNNPVTLTVTTAEGCSSTTSDVNVFVGVKEVVASASFEVYPNPNNGRFTVNFVNAENDKYAVSVKNILGQVVYNRKMNIGGNYKMFIDLSGFNAGMYFLTVSNSQGEKTQKIIVK